MLLLGNNTGSKGASKFTAGSGNDTAIGGAGDYFDLGSGYNRVELKSDRVNNESGATVAMTAIGGKTEVNGFNFGFSNNSDKISLDIFGATVSYKNGKLTFSVGNASLVLNFTDNSFDLADSADLIHDDNLIDNSAKLDNFKSDLQYWERSPNAKLTLYTENAVYLQNKNFFDDVKVIANAFDLLCYHYDLPAEFKRNFGSEEDWQHLLELLAETGNFKQAFCKELAVDGFSASSLKNFGEHEKFQKWFLWLGCKFQSYGYVARCAKETFSPEEFITKIYELILSCGDEENFNELCQERRTILSLMKNLPPESFLESVRQSEKKLALKILTDNSHAERLLIFETLQKFRFNEYDIAKEFLKQVFPLLAKYLSSVGNEVFTLEQAEYFRRYRWLKVTNNLTDNFNRHVTEIAKNTVKNIYALPSRNQVVGEEYSDDTTILFVDGIGAEYLNFFVEEFSLLTEKFSAKYRISRCNLPSVTENNKDFLQNRNVLYEILDLDTLKHTNLNYPENILSELKFLVTLKEKVLHAIDNFKKIIICSDHGTSRLAVLARQKISDNAFSAKRRRIYKSGRFADAMEGDANFFSTALEYDGKIIFADYSRFIQKGSTGSEVHGGATWEEILVPVITIERREKVAEQKIKSTLPAKKIKRGIAKNEDFNI